MAFRYTDNHVGRFYETKILPLPEYCDTGDPIADHIQYFNELKDAVIDTVAELECLNEECHELERRQVYFVTVEMFMEITSQCVMLARHISMLHELAVTALVSSDVNSLNIELAHSKDDLAQTTAAYDDAVAALMEAIKPAPSLPQSE